jgi:peptidoglycan/xylan/chitin deacetylase (PgdA/CDA1 family)
VSRLTRLARAWPVAVLLTACAGSGPDRNPGLLARLAPPRAVFDTRSFVVTHARGGDTPESLAARYLGDASRAWMIEDFNETSRFQPGQPVVIPRRQWNLAGVTPSGYQLVPVLVYHNIGPRARGRLVISAGSFDAQMRFLKANGYRVVRLAELYDFVSLRRQLPRRAVVLTFDDGYKSFLRYAYPILRELGYPATLFVYTDYVGVSGEAMSWGELRALQAEGFDVQPHSKTHSDLRRRPDEPEDTFARRMREELAQPRELFARQLGRPGEMLAYPYGFHDDAVVQTATAHGYVAGFDVVRESNPAFTRALRIHRRQIYADMTLHEFARNLAVFQEEPLR